MTVVGYPSEVDSKDDLPIEMGSTQPTGAMAASTSWMIGWMIAWVDDWMDEWMDDCMGG